MLETKDVIVHLTDLCVRKLTFTGVTQRNVKDHWSDAIGKPSQYEGAVRNGCTQADMSNVQYASIEDCWNHRPAYQKHWEQKASFGQKSKAVQHASSRASTSVHKLSQWPATFITTTLHPDVINQITIKLDIKHHVGEMSRKIRHPQAGAAAGGSTAWKEKWREITSVFSHQWFLQFLFCGLVVTAKSEPTAGDDKTTRRQHLF